MTEEFKLGQQVKLTDNPFDARSKGDLERFAKLQRMVHTVSHIKDVPDGQMIRTKFMEDWISTQWFRKVTLKPFWDNLFYDLHECGLTEEEFAIKAGEEILSDLCRIEDAIREYDGKFALAIIEELKGDY